MTTEASAETTGIDLAGYLHRIGHSHPVEPTVETLHALVAAHNRAIPFEKLFVRATLGHAPFFQAQDLRGIAHGKEMQGPAVDDG